MTARTARPFDWATDCPEYAPTVPRDPRAAIYAAANELAWRVRR